uniref:Uncharacterized protein n=1 Tax=Anguilla anguilla TaxID=7936 RepID=A0A0E9TM93_ANGAN
MAAQPCSWRSAVL